MPMLFNWRCPCGFSFHAITENFLNVLKREHIENHHPDRLKLPIAGVWLRRIEDHVEVLVEIDGQWRLVSREWHDSFFSHIAEVTDDGSRWPADTLTQEPTT